jgi:predicted enzyme related to lactoylglutathione lyase
MNMATIPTGRFVWFELVTKDPQKAQGFLGELFHWKTEGMPIPAAAGGGTYTMVKNGDKSIGGYMPTPQGAPPHAHWISHLQVDDTNAVVAKVKANGGRVLSESHKMDMGTHTIVADPLGGALALWQPAKAEGTGDWSGNDGSFCWNELFTEDPAKSVAFYKAIGGFEEEKMEMGPVTYHLLKSEGKPRGGVMKPMMPGVPQAWLPYVQVASADATHEKAKRLGATILVTPTDIPNVGRFSILADTQGATIGVLQPKR